MLGGFYIKQDQLSKPKIHKNTTMHVGGSMRTTDMHEKRIHKCFTSNHGYIIFISLFYTRNKPFHPLLEGKHEYFLVTLTQEFLFSFWFFSTMIFFPRFSLLQRVKPTHSYLRDSWTQVCYNWTNHNKL